jgi:hypothetical protein
VGGRFWAGLVDRASYRAYFADERVVLFPGSKVTSLGHLPPMDDVGEAWLGQPARRPGHLAREDGAAGWHVDGVADGGGEPAGDLTDAFPLEPR